MYKAGDCFVIEIGKVIEDGAGYLTNANIIVNDEFLDKLDRLDGDYINEYYGHLQDEAYNKGLEDAWKLIKEIFYMPTKEYKEIFDICCVDVLSKYTPQEALAKLEAYEKEQEEIKVGDVFEFNHSRCCVVKVSEDNAKVLWKSGNTAEGQLDFIKKQKKIKHIDLTDLFKQIGGGDNE